MAQISDHVDVQAILQTAVAPAMGFGTQLFLVDDEQIPIDRRYRYTTKSGYADDFEIDTPPYDYALTYYSQKRTPDDLMIGRMVLTDIGPVYVMEDYETDYSVWATITEGSLVFTDSEDNIVEIDGLDFHSVTAFSQVLTILNAALALVTPGTIVGLENATFEVDSLGRLVLNMNAGDSTSPTVVISSTTGSDAPAFIMPDYEDGFAVWELVVDGAFKVTDSEANTTTVSGISFDGVTTFAGVLTKLNDALAALSDPDVEGLDEATFSVITTNGANRLALIMPTGQDAESPTVTIGAPAAGTDLSGATYMGVSTGFVVSGNIPSDTFAHCSTGFAVSGVDAESPVTALQAIREIDNSFYNVHERGCSIAQQLALAQYIETQELLLDLVTNDDNAVDATKITDIGYLCKALSLKRTLIIYTTKDDEYPDAAVSGCVFPTTEGSCSFAYEVLSQVTESGASGTPLTAGEIVALKAKNYNWIETIGSNTYMYNGLTSGGEEKRIMLGRDWFVARIRENIFTSMLNAKLHAFDLATFTIVEGIIRKIGDEAIIRSILVNTVDRPFVVTMPDPDTITPAERASHEFDHEEIFSGYLNSAINDYKIVGTWSL